ncbi:2'-5' RNA ligase family protein [Microbacterium sp. P02]|uniref:2'-5' RNA ligase family protein n=1 Tax=Microbacterium sp. P02 TaxID=3366260 RepID=UPI003670B84B
MSDVVSIELLLDPESDASVRGDWDRLARAGHSSLGSHRSPSNSPHVTLLVRPALAQNRFAQASALLPVTLSLGSPIVFAHGDRGVLVRPVLLTPELQALHAAVHAAAAPGEDAPHTAPGEWTPHVSLARRLRLTSLPEALELLGPESTASGVGLRRWDSASATVTTLD